MANEEIMNVVKKSICAQLKSPASAKFSEDLITITGDDSQGYHVEGFVDSQNSYGAMIRNDFTADVIIEDGSPKVTKSTVAIKANANRNAQFIKKFIILMAISTIGGLIMYFIISKAVGL